MMRLRLLAGVASVLALPGIVSASGWSSGPSYPDVVRADSPTGYWRLGEAVDATAAADASGRGHTGRYGTGTTPGVGGALASDDDTAARFPGAPAATGTADVVVPSATDLNFGSGDFTVEAWVRPTFTAETTKTWQISGEHAIAAKVTGVERCPNADPTVPADIKYPGWAVTVTDDSGYAGRVRAAIAYGQTAEDPFCPTQKRLLAYGPNIRVDDGEWHYVAVVFQRASGVTVYVDGISQQTAGATAPSISDNASLTIGSEQGFQPWAGDIDEPAVYDHALSADRIEAHRQAGLRPDDPTPDEPGNDGTDTPGLVQLGATSSWRLSNAFDGSTAQSFTSFCCGSVVIGDWDGDGIDSPAFFDAGQWRFNDGYDDYVDLQLSFGAAGDTPVAGDWDGDGIATPGYRRGSTWYLSETFAGTIDHVVDFGDPSATPVVGDWDGDGRDTIGVFKDGTWQLSNTLTGTVDATATLGAAGDTPVAGDWNGDGKDTIGARSGTTWTLSDSLGGSADHRFDYGAATDVAVTGDWDNDVQDGAETLDGPSPLIADAIAADPPAVVQNLAPVVWLNENTSRDDWFNPASAYTYFIKHTPLKWMRPSAKHVVIRGRGRVRPLRLGAASGHKAYHHQSNENDYGIWVTYYANQLTRPYQGGSDRHLLNSSAGFYLDLPNNGDIRHGQRDPNNVPAYYDYKPGRWIAFHFFYAYDFGGGDFNHEGDWEGIAIRLHPDNTPWQVHLYRHRSNCGVTKDWNDMNFDPTTHRLVVYAAHADHASYSAAGTDGADLLCHPFLDDRMAQTERWETWRHLGAVRLQNWYGFGGAWGEPGTRAETTGPLGPSRWKLGVPDGW